MNRLIFFTLVTIAATVSRAQFNYIANERDPDEGLQLFHDPTRQYTGSNMRLAWYSVEGRTYYIEQSEELAPGLWTCISPYPIYSNTFRNSHAFDFDVSLQTNNGENTNTDAYRVFFRLRYTEGPSSAGNNQPFADSDHDGVRDHSEQSGPYQKTHPLQFANIDNDDLADDWEYHQVGNLTELSGDTELYGGTAYVMFKRDWVRGITARYGTQFFRFKMEGLGLLENSIFLTGDQNGAMLVEFSDNSYSVLKTIEVFPNYNPSYLQTNDPALVPAAVYSYEPDYAGLTYSQREGTGPFAGTTGRDLLRGIELMDTPPGANRPSGETRLRPFKRSQATVAGVTKTVLTPASLAITSQPPTRITPRTYPVVLRDMDSHQNASSGTYVDFTSAVPPPETFYRNALKPNLGPDGLPVANDDPEYYLSGQAPFKSPRSFATWYRSDNAQTYMLHGLPALAPAEPGFLPPVPIGHTQRYSYGLFLSDLYPHAADVGTAHTEDKNGFTTEWRMKLDYDETTRLYFAADDDCWLFINGILIQELARGGVNLKLYEPAFLNLAQIRPRLGLIASIGTCDVAIFHAARLNSPTNQQPALRLLSTSPLRPVYHYQIIAENDNLSAIQYELVSGPDGMAVSASTGRLEWDVFRPDLSALIGTTQTVTVRATDTAGNSALQTFTIEIANN